MGVKSLGVSLVMGLVLWPITATLTASVSFAQSVAVREESAADARHVLITVSAQQASLAKVLREIATQANLAVAFPDGVRLSPARVTVDVREMPLDQVLAKVLEGTGFKATVTSGGIGFPERESVPVMVQGSISGKVINGKTRQGLRDAAVSLSGTNKRTTTSDDGSFRFSNIAPGAYTIQVRMLGFVKAAQSITVAEGQAVSMEITMIPNVSMLDQVVVTGTVIPTERRAIPNAMTVITAKEIEQRGITKIDQLFRGDVPGLFAQNQGARGQLDEVVMFSRGATALQEVSTKAATNPIKTYVDGVEMVDATYLNQIDPGSIERIEILTGPQASTIYGSNAINGVMQIFTKRGSPSGPRLDVLITSGIIQNNISSHLAPRNSAIVRATGIEGRWSYNAGGAWDYEGAWTPGKQTTRLTGSGGGQMQYSWGTVDVSARRTLTRNRSRGNSQALWVDCVASGGCLAQGAVTSGRSAISTAMVTGQTGGAALTYRPKTWWTHEFVFGTDNTDVQQLNVEPRNVAASDTLRYLSQTQSGRTSQRYASTVQVPLGLMNQATITIGADHWRMASTSLTISPALLTGTLASVSSPTIRRKKPGSNMGGFLQGQLEIQDQLFLTYGLRAEWNPDYGEDAQPNMAPRYGIAYTHNLGILTVKTRASYGRATRPPAELLRESVSNALSPTGECKITSSSTTLYPVTRYGVFNCQISNPDLGPEYQQGGEGGIELFWDTRGSLVITRFNQTVDGLIAYPVVDSVISLEPGTDGLYTYAGVRQNLNIGSIRNQGWELQGTATLGSVTARGTYSWVKSRVIGITPKYRTVLTAAGYRPGASFGYLSEHTWAWGITYARPLATIALSVSGTGFLNRNYDGLYSAIATSRLNESKPRMSTPNGYIATNHGYASADLNASRRITPRIEGTVSIQNLMNVYQNDYDVRYPTMGRRSTLGVRVR